jgi:hypothetical protein
MASAKMEAGTVISDMAEPLCKSKCQPHTEWVKNLAWTDTLIAYLCDNTGFHIKLFSDSMAAATKAGRPKLTVKDGRPQQWAVLAVAIFTDDEDQKEAFKENPVKFANSVDTHM